MAEPGKSERWNSLLETLGVPVKEQVTPQPPTESAPSKPQPVSMLPPKKQKEPPKPKAGPPAAKSPSYWSRIAGALGLDVGTVPEPKVDAPKSQRIEESKAEPAEEPRREAPRRPVESPAPEREVPPRAFQRPRRDEQRPPRERPRREERPRHEERARHEDRAPSEEPAGRSTLNDKFGGKGGDVDVFSLGGEESSRLRESSEARTREDEERGSVLDYDVPDGSGSDLALGRSAAREEDREEISREGGQGRDGGRRRRRRGRGRRGRGEVRPGGPPQQHEADIEPAGEEADFDLDRDEALELESEHGAERSLPADEPVGGMWREPQEEPGRYPPSGERPSRERDEERGGRGRRGRGRGRDRDRDRDRSAGERPAPYRGEQPPRIGPPRKETAERMDPADDEIDDELSAEIDEADEGRGGDVPTHKKIPTWEEAVNILIDANMANRGPERDRGYGRGRGRR